MRRRAAVYSSSRQPGGSAAPAPALMAPEPVVVPVEAPPPTATPGRRLKVSTIVALALALTASLVGSVLRDTGDIRPLPEPAATRPSAADAYARIRPSVVRVRGLPQHGSEGIGDAAEENLGTGVVMVDSGIILTNLHVVQGVQSVKVVFADGLETDAEVIGVRPEHDLAVLQAKEIPDDLEPATMRSTNGLRPGDEVVAVGFPFGIGPSASAGVIAGLRREYQSASGQRLLTNLIQFDAAVNPGNSGGPLVTADGEVIDIVTGLLNPTEQRVFIGIGFAVPIENAAGAIGLSPF
jgi:S1-C subfamily serine protease